MPELDSLRGVACILVLFFHGFGNHYSGIGLNWLERPFFALTRYGWTGVNLFFVLSGFLITGILLDGRSAPQYFKRFYFRRVLRILPAYYGILFLLLFLSRTGLVDRPVSYSFLGLSAVYLANSTMLFGVPQQYGVLWSLAVEEHFYLLWPLIVRKLRLRVLTTLALLICVVSLAARVGASRLGFDAMGKYTWLVADGLAMGALLAIAARFFNQDRTALWKFAVAAFGLSALGYLVDIPLGHSFAGGSLHITSVNAFYSGVITTTVLLGSRFQIRNRVLGFFGEISYGLYLIHMLCFDLYDHFVRRLFPGFGLLDGKFSFMCIRFSISIALAVGLATLSRWYFEEPFLRLKNRGGQTTHASGKESCFTDSPARV